MDITKLEKELIKNILYDDTFIETGINYKDTIQIKENFWENISEQKYTLYDFYLYNLLQCLTDKNGIVYTTVNLLQDRCKIKNVKILECIKHLSKIKYIEVDKINKITYNTTLKILVNDVINIKDKTRKVPKEYILRLISFLDEEELGSLLYIIANYKYSFDLIKIDGMTEKELYNNNSFIKKYDNNNCSRARIGKRLCASDETIRRKLNKLIDEDICIKPQFFIIPSILNRVEYVYNCIISDIENKISSNKIEDGIVSEDTDITDEEILYTYCKSLISLYKETFEKNNYNLIKDKLIIFQNYEKPTRVKINFTKNNKSNKKQRKDNHETSRNIPAKLRLKLLNESARWVESEQKYIPACKFCGKTALETTLHIDHIIPYSKGGETIEDNLQVLCEECNEQKNNKYELIINKKV